MAKRLSETKRWEDRWYRKLSPLIRNFWDYVCCQCDNAGVWKPDFEVVALYVGSVNSDESLSAFNDGKERILLLTNGYWLIIEYVSFQFGKEVKNQKIHKHVLDLQLKYVPFGYPMDTLLIGHTLSMDAAKSKSKDKSKDKEKSKSIEQPSIENLIIEINDLKSLGWQEETIKSHLVGTREILAELVETAMGKKF